MASPLFYDMLSVISFLKNKLIYLQKTNYEKNFFCDDRNDFM